jgi:hypothetical protein
METGGPSQISNPYPSEQPQLLPHNTSSLGSYPATEGSSTVNRVDQTIPQIANRQVDEIGHMDPEKNGHPGENGSHVDLEREDMLVTALEDGFGGDGGNYELLPGPFVDALQSQTDTLLAEGYGAGPDTQSCQLDTRLLESIHTIIGQPGDPLDEGNQPRSPTPSLTTEAASAEQTNTGSEFHHLHDRDEPGVFEPAPEMVEHPTMDWLEENCFNRPLFHSAPDGSISTRRLATDESVASSAHRPTGSDRDGAMMMFPPTIGPSHQPSGSAPSRPWPRSTPPLTEGPTGSEPIRSEFVSASSSTYFQGFFATPLDRPSTSIHPAVVSKPRRDASPIPPAQRQSSGSRLPSSPTELISQTRPVVTPSLGLTLSTPEAVRHSQAMRSNSRAGKRLASFDDAPEWIDHFKTLSMLASGLKLRDPMPGDKVSQNQAFVSFRSLFIQLLSFSAKGSMMIVPAAVSCLDKASRLSTLTDNTGI